jgi:hypothetical protein
MVERTMKAIVRQDVVSQDIVPAAGVFGAPF